MAKVEKKPIRKKPRRKVSDPLEQISWPLSEFGFTPEMVAAGLRLWGPGSQAERDKQRAQRVAEDILERAAAEATIRRAALERAKAELADARPPPAKVLDPQAWLKGALRTHPRQPGERIGKYAERLHEMMQQAAVAKRWPLTTLLRRLHK